MQNFKKYLASQLLDKTYRFKCNCILHLDVVGTVKDFDLVNNEIVLIVDVKGKLIKIGGNSPGLEIERIFTSR